MSFKNKITRLTGVFLIMVTLFLFIAPDIAEARRGFGGFGGGRSFGRSFGGSRSFRSTPRTTPRSSFGRRTSPATAPKMTSSQRAASSFGGKRLQSSGAYTQKYGTPRKSVTQSYTRNGVTQNYVVNSYGGYGSGLMTGYMMGHTSWMWMMPFHPAFYYSRPYYADNPDGTVSVYPPTFSWSKLFFTIIIFGVIVYIIVAIIRSRGRGGNSQSSFS
jgi:hypothetical protein